MALLIEVKYRLFRKYRFSKKNAIRAFIIFALLTTITFINDSYIRIHFPTHDAVLRLSDHLFAGIGIPFILFFAIGSFYRRCLFYFFWCTMWEIQQFIERDYFQFHQYGCDLLGMCIAIYLYQYHIDKRKII